MTLFGGVTYSPTAPDTELELLEAPSKTEEPRSLSPTSAPPSPDYTPATLHTDDESEPFETSKTRVTSPHFTTSPADPISPPSPQRPPLTQTSPAHTPPRAFYYRSTARMAEDEGTNSKDEDTVLESQQQQTVLAEDTAKDEPLGLGYRAARYCALE
ncbi:hypothetical protein Tco_1031881 [Tanacetum coccineum]|uniref:Uncharacterized protein n=1 Tax=Tanacetum coccineum TaxID=301880 RepID=A0ABQ5GAS4_9ASTR